MHYEVEREGEEVEVPLEGVSFIYPRYTVYVIYIIGMTHWKTA